MKIQLYIFFSLLPILAMSQSFTFEPSDTIESIYYADDWPSETIFIQNDSTTSVSLSFEVVNNTFPDVGWSSHLCTNLYCYLNTPSSGNLGVIQPGEKAFLTQYLVFNNFVGTGELIIKIYDSNNPSNVDTISFILHTEALTDVFDIRKEVSLNLFPNPTHEILNIELTNKLFLPEQVQIFNSNGQIVLNKIISQSQDLQLNVANLESGLYITKIQDSSRIQFSKPFIKL